MTSPIANDDLTLTDAEFRMFANLVRDHSGLDFSDSSRFFTRASPRSEGPASWSSGVSQPTTIAFETAAADPMNFRKLIDELTTNETYFFREYSQLRALIDEIFEELQLDRERRGSRPINVWSAGCSSGEEPYSIAMLAREAGLKSGVDVRVYASDISRRNAAKGTQGDFIAKRRFRDPWAPRNASACSQANEVSVPVNTANGHKTPSSR